MKRFLLLLVLLLAAFTAWIVFSLLSPGLPSMPLARGRAVKVEPGGPRVAVREEGDAWGIYEAGGRRIAGFRCAGEPFWGEAGGSGSGDRGGCIYFTPPGGGLRGMGFEGGLNLRDLPVEALLPPSLSGPVRVAGAAGPGRLLLTAGGRGALRGIVVAGLPGKAREGPRPEALPLEIPGALAFVPDPKGEKVAVLVAAGEGRRNLEVVGVRGGDASGGELLRLEGIASEEVRWSGCGRYLLFATEAGTVELYDFERAERRWVEGMPPAVVERIGLQAVFDPAGTRLFLVRPDAQGFLQIASIALASGQTYSFTSGWADHYGPALSPGGRYIAYRQADLPGHGMEESGGEGRGVEESIYLWDFEERRTLLLGTRTVSLRSWRMRDRGPRFSGDGRFVYAVMNGVVRQYALEGS